MEKGLIAIAAAIAVFTGFGSTLGQSYSTAKAVEAVGKNPEAEGKIRNMLLLGNAVAETAAIYGLLIAILLIFAY